MKIAVLIAAGLLCVSASPAQDRIREKIDSIYGRGGYQRELPTGAPVEAAPHGKSRGTADFREPLPHRPWDIPEWLARILSWLVSVLPWVALGILGILIVVGLIRMNRPAGSREPRRDEAPPPVASVASPDEALPDAERLARDGRFVEAIHAILLHAIDRLRPRAPAPLAASLTSREIMASAELEAERQAAFGRIVRAVELTIFGGHAAGPDDYRECAAALAIVGAGR